MADAVRLVRLAAETAGRADFRFRDRVCAAGAAPEELSLSEAFARHAGIDDPGFIVWDEVLAFWLVLWVLTPATPVMQLIAFGLFRYFDAAKPGPVRWADRRFKGGGWRGGFGILFDDLVAAGCTLFVIATAITFARLLHGQLAG